MPGNNQITETVLELWNNVFQAGRQLFAIFELCVWHWAIHTLSHGAVMTDFTKRRYDSLYSEKPLQYLPWAVMTDFTLRSYANFCQEQVWQYLWEKLCQSLWEQLWQPLWEQLCQSWPWAVITVFVRAAISVLAWSSYDNHGLEQLRLTWPWAYMSVLVRRSYDSLDQ